MSTRVNVTFNDDKIKELEYWAKQHKVSMCEIIRKYVDKGLEEDEDQKLFYLLEQDLKESEGKPLISHEDAWKDFLK